MLDKRSQTATEYMVILAIVIIIALIVAGILGQFPGIGGSTRTRGNSAYWTSADVGVIVFSVSEDGANDDAVITLRNNQDITITVTDIELDGTLVYSNSTVIPPGESETLNLDDIGSPCTSAGSSFSLALNLTYVNSVTGNSFNFLGDGNNLEGTCAI